MSDSYYELFWSVLILLMVALNIYSTIKSRRPISLPLIAFWVAGLSIGALPGASYLVDKQIFLANTGVESNSLYLSYLFFLVGLWVTTLHTRRANTTRLDQVVATLGVAIKFRNILPLILIAYFVRAVDMAVYGGGMSGLGTAEYQMGKPYLFTVIQMLVGVLRPASIIWLFYHVGNRINVVTILILVEFILTFFFFGRRELFLFVSLFFLVKYLKRGRIGIKAIFTGLILLAFTVQFMFPAFIAFRDGYIGYRSTGDSVGVLFEKGISNISDDSTVSGDAYETRLASRLLGTDYYSRILLERQRYIPSMGGDAFYGALMNVIPRFLSPNKSLVHPEAQVTKHYAIYSNDPASTILSTGIADFGVFGGGIAGLLLGLILRGGARLAVQVSKFSPLIGCVIYLNFLNNALRFEIGPVTLFSDIRSSLLLLAFALVLQVFRRRTNARIVTFTDH